VIIDPKKEKNAVNEARKLGIATVALIDTDCDPDTIDLPIPGNDDSMRSIEIVVKMLADAIISGKSHAAIASQQNAEGADKSERSERLQPA
jgi:small subunit ribosomal protein S2